MALDGPLPPELEALATGLLARIHLARGEGDRAVALLLRAIELDRRAGLVSAASEDALALVYALVWHGRDLASARQVMTALADVIEQYPEGRARAPYYRALIAHEAVDLRHALRDYDLAAVRAQRLGLAHLERIVQRERAFVLRSLGDAAGARTLLDRQIAEAGPGVSDCEYANLLLNRAQIGLATIDEAHDGAGSPTRADTEELERWLEKTRAISERSCPRPFYEAAALTAAADLALRTGRTELAQQRLTAARRIIREASTDEAWHRWQRWFLSWKDLDGRLALARGDSAAALDHYRALDALARKTRALQGRWLAAYGRGRAAERLGRIGDALAAYASAERWLDVLARRIPLGEGRPGFYGRHEASTRRYVALLLEQGREAEAFAVARRARARFLTRLQWSDRVAALPRDHRARWDALIQRYRVDRERLETLLAGEWRLSKAELGRSRAERDRLRRSLDATMDQAFELLAATAPLPDLVEVPVDGVLSLYYFPLPDGRWVAFEVEDGRLRSRRLDPVDLGLEPAQLAERLLGPSRDAIERARALRVVPSGALNRVDFHALPWKDHVLLAEVPIGYAVDIAPESSPIASPPNAVVIADPLGDLPGARAEASRVSRALAAVGWRVDLLTGPDAARAERVREALRRATLLHYAGHGVTNGGDGWDSALMMADGGRLGLADVLTLPTAPAFVVLAACETTSADGRAMAGVLGMAQAFIMRGSRAVIATTREIPDGLELGAALYDALAGELDLVQAARRAQLEIRAHAPDADWAAFRAVIP